MGEPREQHGVRPERHRHLERVYRRRADGSLWRTATWSRMAGSWPKLEVQKEWLLQRVVREHRWWWPDCWVDAPQVWAPSAGEFQVLDEEEAIPT